MRHIEAGSTEWARVAVRKYEDGERVPKATLQAAMQVLCIKPGTLLRKVKSRGVDRMALAAQACDDEDEA